MLTFHSTMPVLRPETLRRLETSWLALAAILAGVSGTLLGPGPVAALAMVGGLLTVQVLVEAALHNRARRRGSPRVRRREWRAAWREASRDTPLPWLIVRALFFGFGVVQVSQGRPAWALDANGWTGGAVAAACMFLF